MKRRELRPELREGYVGLVQDNTRNDITCSIDLSIVNCKFKCMKLLNNATGELHYEW
jgi:hypothetical protein